MSAGWEVVRPGALPGDVGPLLIVDRGDGPDGRTVCAIPGHLVHRRPDGAAVRLLDEQDLENALLFAAACDMRHMLARLVGWERRMGGRGDPCWADARKLLALLPRRPGAGGVS
jgi:hypothetical protein